VVILDRPDEHAAGVISTILERLGAVKAALGRA
jgi:hypothetical protein